MKKLIWISVLVIALIGCEGKQARKNPIKRPNWNARMAENINFDNYGQGKTYLPVYSHIYHIHEQFTFDLTITVSIRNISPNDTVFISKADYYNTAGDNIRQYVKSPIFIKPLETIEIVISEQDSEGGSGANFVFDWMIKNVNNPPLFEAVMISTHGQQGLSFKTQGISVFD